jgi:hypothetical protein
MGEAPALSIRGNGFMRAGKKVSLSRRFDQAFGGP